MAIKRLKELIDLGSVEKQVPGKTPNTRLKNNSRCLISLHYQCMAGKTPFFFKQREGLRGLFSETKELPIK